MTAHTRVHALHLGGEMYNAPLRDHVLTRASCASHRRRPTSSSGRTTRLRPRSPTSRPRLGQHACAARPSQTRNRVVLLHPMRAAGACAAVWRAQDADGAPRKGQLSTRDLFFLLSMMPALEALWVCTKDMCVSGYWDDGPRDLGSWYVRDASVLDGPACKLRYYRCASPCVGWELPVAGSLDSTRDLELKLGWAVDCAQDAAILLRIAPCLRSLVIHIDDRVQARFLLPALAQCGRLRTLKLFVARRSFSAAAALALFGALAEAWYRLVALEFDPAPAEEVLSAFTNGKLLETSGAEAGYVDGGFR